MDVGTISKTGMCVPTNEDEYVLSPLLTVRAFLLLPQVIEERTSEFDRDSSGTLLYLLLGGRRVFCEGFVGVSCTVST